eukprot:TRINITY_DN9466_c0_g3_i2.p1 TRINITY_DN9466_c0_g3~~TRINITY_DN9466_c0_g3_i2.p1  ORF type:complete len:315 (+),score=33.42 TRINITY_DN9466_c0_g3_i2:146-1090(+)
MVSFSLQNLSADFDFGVKNSEYKTKFLLGNAKGVLSHNLASNCAAFELEGKGWEVGYKHKGKTLHGKKKWRVSKNALFIVRQDVPDLKFAVIPSPKLQLEHEVKNVVGLDANKLELKYDTFWKRAEVEEEAKFASNFKVKGSIDNKTKLYGGKLQLKAEFANPWFSEMSVSTCKAVPVELEYRIKPLKGFKVKAKAAPFDKRVSADFEYQFSKEGLKMEVQNKYSKAGWAAPTMQVAFTFDQYSLVGMRHVVQTQCNIFNFSVLLPGRNVASVATYATVCLVATNAAQETRSQLAPEGPLVANCGVSYWGYWGF